MTSIVLFDIDGTILPARGRIPQSAIEAIRRLRQKGHLAVINTGRCRPIIPDEIIDIGFDGFICACGSYIEWEGTLIENHTMSQDLIDLVFAALDHEAIFTAYEGSETLVYYSKSKKLEDRIGQAWGKSKINKVAEPYSGSLSCVNKLSCHFTDRAAMVKAYRDFQNHLYEIPHGDHFTEYVMHGFSKASAISHLTDRISDVDKIYAIGDSANDFHMIEEADIGIAMGNGVDLLKDHADYITDHILEDGLAKALRHFNLI